MLLKSRQGQHIHERASHQRPEMRLGPHQQRPEMRLGAHQQRPEMRLGAHQQRPEMRLEAYQQRPEMRFQSDQQRQEMSLRADQQRPEMNPRLRADYFRSSITDKAIGFTTPCLLGLPHHVYWVYHTMFIGFTTPCLLGLRHHVWLSKKIVFITLIVFIISYKCLLESSTPNATLKIRYRVHLILCQLSLSELENLKTKLFYFE